MDPAAPKLMGVPDASGVAHRAAALRDTFHFATQQGMTQGLTSDRKTLLPDLSSTSMVISYRRPVSSTHLPPGWTVNPRKQASSRAQPLRPQGHAAEEEDGTKHPQHHDLTTAYLDAHNPSPGHPQSLTWRAHNPSPGGPTTPHLDVHNPSPRGPTTPHPEDPQPLTRTPTTPHPEGPQSLTWGAHNPSLGRPIAPHLEGPQSLTWMPTGTHPACLQGQGTATNDGRPTAHHQA